MPILYVVATPIGNLNDLSPRVREALEKADLVAAEDTRVAMKLLNHLGLSKPTVSCHRHNEEGRSGPIIERMLRENLTVALTCDAGTPAISDPGQVLVDAAWRAGDIDQQQKIFGDTIDARRGRPTCGEMIAQLADILRWEG